MTVTLRFSFYGDVQLDRTLGRFAVAAADMRPAWAQLRALFVEMERRQFGSEGGNSGGWRPLTPAYARWKASHYPGMTILKATSHLFDTLTNGPDIDIEEPSYAIFGTGDPVGAYHQRGAGRLPQRRPIELTEADRQEWVRVIQAYLLHAEAAV